MFASLEATMNDGRDTELLDPDGSLSDPGDWNPELLESLCAFVHASAGSDEMLASGLERLVQRHGEAVYPATHPKAFRDPGYDSCQIPLSVLQFHADGNRQRLATVGHLPVLDGRVPDHPHKLRHRSNRATG